METEGLGVGGVWGGPSLVQFGGGRGGIREAQGVFMHAMYVCVWGAGVGGLVG